MGYYVSVPTSIIYDKSIRDVDLRLYLIIAENVNSMGYCEAENDKLTELTGKTKNPILKAIRMLEEAGHIIVKYNVKKNSVYAKNKARVIWLSEAYHKHIADKKQAKKQNDNKVKTPWNDKQTFVAYLRSKFVDAPLHVKVDGIKQMYVIQQDGLMWNHSLRRNKPLRKEDSYIVFQILWENKEVVLKDRTGMPDIDNSKKENK